MDPTAFDALTRAFQTAASRRRLLRLGSALLPAGLLSALLGEATEAGRAHRRSLRNRRHSGNNKQNRKGKRKGQNQDQGVGQPLDCPDATISCWVVEPNGTCSGSVNRFGPVGHCGHGLSCCPCAPYSEYAYWHNLCNSTFPECKGGRCVAQDDILIYGCASFPAC